MSHQALHRLSNPPLTLTLLSPPSTHSTATEVLRSKTADNVWVPFRPGWVPTPLHWHCFIRSCHFRGMSCRMSTLSALMHTDTYHKSQLPHHYLATRLDTKTKTWKCAGCSQYSEKSFLLSFLLKMVTLAEYFSPGSISVVVVFIWTEPVLSRSALLLCRRRVSVVCENFWRWLRLYSCSPAGSQLSCDLWCGVCGSGFCGWSDRRMWSGVGSEWNYFRILSVSLRSRGRRHGLVITLYLKLLQIKT